MKPLRRFGVQLEQGATRFMLSIFTGAATAFLDHWDANTRSELAHG